MHAYYFGQYLAMFWNYADVQRNNDDSYTFNKLIEDGPHMNGQTSDVM